METHSNPDRILSGPLSPGVTGRVGGLLHQIQLTFKIPCNKDLNIHFIFNKNPYSHSLNVRMHVCVHTRAHVCVFMHACAVMVEGAHG